MHQVITFHTIDNIIYSTTVVERDSPAFNQADTIYIKHTTSNRKKDEVQCLILSYKVAKDLLIALQKQLMM